MYYYIYEVTSTGLAGSYTVGPKKYTGDVYDENGGLWILPPIKSVLIDMKNSKLYDFSEFQPQGDSLPRFMESNIIYTVKDHYL